MKGKILNNGIYFFQQDEKVDGYYARNKHGEWEKYKYVKPSIGKRLKHLLIYGHELSTETRTTLYFHFSEFYPNKVCCQGFKGDAITTAKEARKSFDLDYFYIIKDDKMIFEMGSRTVEIEFSDDGRTLTALFIDNKSQEFIDRNVFTFLEWDNL